MVLPEAVAALGDAVVATRRAAVVRMGAARAEPVDSDKRAASPFAPPIPEHLNTYNVCLQIILHAAQHIEHLELDMHMLMQAHYSIISHELHAQDRHCHE